MLASALAAMAVPTLVRAEGRPPDAARMRNTLGKLHKAVDAAQAGDCKSATQTIEPMVDGHDPSLPADLLGPIYQVVISCEIRLDRSADAYRHALAGSALENSADDLWRMRIALELDDHRSEAAVVSVETMSQGRGAALNVLPVRWFYQLDRRLKEQNLPGLRRRLLTVLSANAYVPKDQMPGATDGFRHNLANIMLDAGDRTGAAALLADIGNPTELTDIVLDPRLRPLLPGAFDLRAAVEQHLAAMRAFAALHPDKINPVVLAAIDQRLLGRPQESLDDLHALRGVEDGSGTFADMDEQLVWWWDSIGRGFVQLNRYDAAVAAFRKGGEKQEVGGLNVSQIINLGAFQLSFAHPDDALTTIGAFDAAKRPASAYGRMLINYIRGCAQARLDRPAEAAAALKYIQDHDTDAPGVLTDMLLCTGDLDGASASILRLLADPETRPDMLRRVAIFDAPVVALPPNPLKVNLDKVIARPEIQAAIQRAGDAQRIHLQDTEF